MRFKLQFHKYLLRELNIEYVEKQFGFAANAIK